MKEKITINSFCGIRDIELDLKEINVFIGPQASGKSITVKLIYFFKTLFQEMIQHINENDNFKNFGKNQMSRFRSYFPLETWSETVFSVIYKVGKVSIELIKSKASENCRIVFSQEIESFYNNAKKVFVEEQKLNLKSSLMLFNSKFKDNYSKMLEDKISVISKYDQYFIPAGRSFFANIHTNIFTILKENQNIDPFILAFGSFYDSFKLNIDFGFNKSYNESLKPESEFSSDVQSILSAYYKRESKKDFMIHNDERKVKLAYASSGQQEALPLLFVLQNLKLKNGSNNGAAVYIEEPEAHLFPEAQKNMVEFIAKVYNSNPDKFQFFITTHSPYILASFNNLIEAGKILANNPEKKNKLFKIISEKNILKPDSLIAYSIADGVKKKIIDKDTKLISQNLIDSVSDKISIEFGKLLDLEY